MLTLPVAAPLVYRWNVVHHQSCAPTALRAIQSWVGLPAGAVQLTVTDEEPIGVNEMVLGVALLAPEIACMGFTFRVADPEAALFATEVAVIVTICWLVTELG